MAFAGPLIGVVHLPPLPMSPGFRGMEEVLDRAVSDARAYASGGMDALIVENYGDVPFSKDRIGPAATAALALCVRAVRDAAGLPIGVNALRNDASAALGVAIAAGAAFIRVNVHAGVVATDQGLIEGRADRTLRERAACRASVAIAADVHVKHGKTLNEPEIGSAAQDLLDRAAADAVIVTGRGTGHETAREDLERVRRAIGDRMLIAGSGVTPETIREILGIADAAIVGTSLKRDGRTANEVDPKRVEALVQAKTR
jgi:membrane complex biogenesis BtpA family protein